MTCPPNFLLNNHAYIHGSQLQWEIPILLSADCKDSKHRNWGIAKCPAPKAQGTSWRKGKGDCKGWRKGGYDIKHWSLTWCVQYALELTTVVIAYNRCEQSWNLQNPKLIWGQGSLGGLISHCSLTTYIQLTGNSRKIGREGHGKGRERGQTREGIGRWTQ